MIRIPMTLTTTVYSKTNSKNIDVDITGVVTIASQSKTSKLYPIEFVRPIWIQNLRADQDVQRVLEQDDEFAVEVSRLMVDAAFKMIDDLFHKETV